MALKRSKKLISKCLFLFIILCNVLGCQKKTSELSSIKAKTFLIERQSEDGSWDPLKFEGSFAHNDGKIAITALAAAALLEYQDNKSKESCLRAIDFLLKQQKPDGSIGERNYANGISFYFFAKAISQPRNVNQKKFEQLLHNILSKQSEIGAWDYIEANAERNDMSISAWVCMGLNLLNKNQEAQESLTKINKMLNKDKSGAGDDSVSTLASSAYTYGENPNSPSGKVLRSPGTTVQAIILFIKSTVLEFRQSNWVETAKKDQIKALTGNSNASLYQTFFILHARKNGIKFDHKWLDSIQNLIQKDQVADGSWPLTSPPIQFGGKIMATAMGLILLQELKK
jgi:hypothetical protein